MAACLAGGPTLGRPEGEDVLEQGDSVVFPTGPEGAHAVRNETDEPVRVLMCSAVAYPNATVYPDSDKIGIRTGNKADDLMARRNSGVEYFEGETGGGGGET